MGTGWRKAFCTTIPRDNKEAAIDNINSKHHQQQQQYEQNSQSSSTPRSLGGGLGLTKHHQQAATPRSLAKLGGLFSSTGGSNPSTPRLRCRTSYTSTAAAAAAEEDNVESGSFLISPKLRCKTTPNTPKSFSTTKTPKPLAACSNPSSPRSPFSIFKNSLRLSRNTCGVCTQSMKAGQKMAIFTAECSHSFHFPCIIANVRKQNSLVCPICNSTWKDDVPLLAIHKNYEEEEIIEVKDKLQPSITNHINNTQQEKIKQQQQQQQNKNIKHLDVVTYYNDDEPLLPPKSSSGGFIPTPEAASEIEIDDEVEEFKGFFVNPISSSSDLESTVSSRDVDVEVKLMPEVALVSVGQTHQTYAVFLKVKAPPPPEPPLVHGGATPLSDTFRRAPIDLVTVLDVGGSMTKAKLQMLKRAMHLVISSLGSADRLSIIAFSASAKRLLPLRRMNVQGQRSARRVIDRLELLRGGCAGDALRKATKILEDRRERNPVASVMLLSDGQDERPQQEDNSDQRPTSNHVSSTRFAHIPVRSSSFGKKTGFSHEPAEDAFAKCVGGLLSVVVQDLRIQLGFAYGSDPGEICAVYPCNGRPTVLSSGTIRLGDLYAEEERELLVELRVPVSGVVAHHVLSVRSSYKDPATQELIYGTDRSLLVPRAQTVGSSGPKIQRVRNMFVTTRAIAESRRLIEHNELNSAQQLLASTRALLLQSASSAADEYIVSLEAELWEIQWRMEYQKHVEQQQQMMMIKMRRVNERETGDGVMVDENGVPLTPTSAWRAAERLAKVATIKKSMNRASDLHGLENARF